ncbi:cytochrome P450 family protein [Aestuariimicrobium ganziense]|uniref:hypothetical protein n=1 Tax=Aestuariimicrobium ganziense TaxID=2773677 RepID=UPI0019405830|nr:hypothetical protein [Aestuariimicrobium ganziense]
MRDEVEDRPFTDAELVSVLRHWTGADLGSIALCVGVLFSYLAERPELQQPLREVADHLDPEGNAEQNVVYGIGPHVGPDRPQATMQLRIVVREVLSRFTIEAVDDPQRVREVAPVGGFHQVPVRLVPLD